MMSGKLEIQNGSLASNVFITLLSIDGSETHLDNKILSTGETIGSIVKGGTKRLIVANNKKDVLWEGVIPTYISQPIMIYPEHSKVIYKDNIIPNMRNQNGIIMNNSYVIVITILILILIICYRYII